MSISKTFEHILSVLNASADPLSFIVIVPKRDDPLIHLRGHLRLLRAAETVNAGEHMYMMGMQHRRTGSSLYWEPKVASEIYWLQNDAGAEMWPVGNGRSTSIAQAWRLHFERYRSRIAWDEE